jgi:hypothetical protein
LVIHDELMRCISGALAPTVCLILAELQPTKRLYRRAIGGRLCHNLATRLFVLQGNITEGMVVR